MTHQWLRSIALDVGTGSSGFALASTSSLRVVFEVERDEKPWPNTAKIQVYNLNPDHRRALSTLQDVPVKLQAGYQDGIGLLFDGMLRDVTSVHDSVDWITTLNTGDGERDRRGEPIAGKTIKQTWSKGTPLVSVLSAFATALNVDMGNVQTMGAAAKLPTGLALTHAFAVDGPALDELIYLMRSLQMPWSIQNGKLQVRPAPAVPASEGPLISTMTGLVGGNVEISREKVKRFGHTIDVKLCKGKCLLLPELKPGCMFVLDSQSVIGTVLATKIKHYGDTDGQDWYTEFEGIYG